MRSPLKLLHFEFCRFFLTMNKNQPRFNSTRTPAREEIKEMDEYLNKGIKEIIDEFPEVEDILSDYEIGCGPCNVGICLLKDIVAIHRLAEDQERQLMARIAKAIHPDQDIRIPRAEKKAAARPGELKYSPPMKKLVDEHVLIKRWIALIPRVVENLDVESEEGRRLILEGIDMIRSYADKYHHAKEEDILFKYFDEEADIIKVMHEDHAHGRSLVKEMLAALDRRDAKTIAANLIAYRELLTEHIRKEDEILYPWMDNQLSTHLVGELYAKFDEVDRQIDVSPGKYEVFIDQLEKKFATQEG
jgi:hemerythrin-like domain-containing protein